MVGSALFFRLRDGGSAMLRGRGALLTPCFETGIIGTEKVVHGFFLFFLHIHYSYAALLGGPW